MQAAGKYKKKVTHSKLLHTTELRKFTLLIPVLNYESIYMKFFSKYEAVVFLTNYERAIRWLGSWGTLINQSKSFLGHNSQIVRF